MPRDLLSKSVSESVEMLPIIRFTLQIEDGFDCKKKIYVAVSCDLFFKIFIHYVELLKIPC